MNISDAYAAYRSLLFGLAYKMLGSAGDAEDAVQEVFASLQEQELSDIRHVKAYLARAVTNRCLNELKTARKRREIYTGVWLPEPLVSTADEDNPASAVDKREDVTYAMLVMLEKLSGIERAVFLLRHAMDFDYSEIAGIVGKSETNCRQMMSRAKAKLGARIAERDSQQDWSKAAALAESFIHASRAGDTGALIRLLSEDAVLMTDGGGKVRAAIFPIIGRDRVTAFMAGVVPKGFLQETCIPVVVGGMAGYLTVRDGKPYHVSVFELNGDGTAISRIYIVKNPDKLAHVTIPPSILS